ncbi:unnamed protein product [Spirodela intermedia]|uniref:Uncharacterized protein n=1 Tax=Spirodela intermedia TaxID=51605 RepID=A0A7I8IC72_SPIIN|nr:unnamed protein product [Spirodela intermedia]CAA6655340.1 unnamed protein product [Spirodela intermedia]
MAPQSSSGAVAGSSGGVEGEGGGGILARLSSSFSESPVVYRGKKIASDAVSVAHKLLRSTGKAAWIAGTTFVILVVPLIIEMDREQQFNELELQQASLLGTAPLSVDGAPPTPK